MPCPKSVVDCPDRIYSQRNAATRLNNALPEKKSVSSVTVIDGKKFVVTPNGR